MTTMADWVRDVVEAAEERGWAVTMIDARANLVVLEEPIGHGGITLRVSGMFVGADFIRTLPDAHRPGEVDVSRGTP